MTALTSSFTVLLVLLSSTFALQQPHHEAAATSSSHAAHHFWRENREDGALQSSVAFVSSLAQALQRWLLGSDGNFTAVAEEDAAISGPGGTQVRPQGGRCACWVNGCVRMAIRVSGSIPGERELVTCNEHHL
jgi:hypothetical protein